MNKTNILLVLVAALGLSTANALADESTTNQVKDKVGDATVATKKAYRTSARKVRKATGTDSTTKDIKDKANDAGDSISNGVDKMKRQGQ